MFDNPFQIEDLAVFDDETLQRLLTDNPPRLTAEQLAQSMHVASPTLIDHVQRTLSSEERSSFLREVYRTQPEEAVTAARQSLLDALFWELIYWKMPTFYDELTEGEALHPGIFQQLAPEIYHKVVLDAGAGSGRATFECLRYGARLVYAVEPSPGLLRILTQKLVHHNLTDRVIPLQGTFSQLPLPAKSVDLILSCSAFTAEPGHGGEQGLIECIRVTKPGGKIVIIWPRLQDHAWLAEHGFHYVTLATTGEMSVHFRSLQSALRCAQRFYARNPDVVHFLLTTKQTDIPFSILNMNPPCDYCWMTV
jgi:ubiquinone/menaquinone biosynthesis C-methylase UbiE